MLHNYAAGRSLRAEPSILQVLAEFSTWRPLDQFLDSVTPEARATAADLVDLLHRDRWLRRRDDPPDAVDSGFDDWGGWNPSAGLFHTATKNTHFLDLDTAVEALEEKARTSPMPAPVKGYPGAETIGLSSPSGRGSFQRVLRDRRTWRRFGRAPVELGAFSTLMHMTAGVQQWVTARGEGRVPFKTSPSGGARHPIEVYVLARRIRTLAPGIYHYASDRHALERLPGSGDPPPFDDILPTQWWYREAAAVVLFTAVFERTRWRYPAPRAYRAVLIEAGHVCQTFCLTATSLGLAPFCSMAIADGAAERLLGIDGVREGVIYAAGVGSRPPLRGAMPGALPRAPRSRKRAR